jgi:hypothetical protein
MSELENIEQELEERRKASDAWHSWRDKYAALEAELAASRAQSAQLAAAGELLLAQVRNGMEISQGEYNYYPDDMDEAVTAWDTALAAWQQGNK